MGADHGKQILVGEHGRGPEHGAGDRGLVIGEPADQAGGRIRRVGESGGQLGPDGGLHVGGQADEHGIIKAVFSCRTGGVAEEALGKFTQQFAAVLARAVGGHRDQVGQAGGRCGVAHG